MQKGTHQVQARKNEYAPIILERNWDDDSHADDIPDLARAGGHSIREAMANNSVLQCGVDLERRLRLFKIWTWLEGLIIIILLLSLILKPLYHPVFNSSANVGSDPSGFVPKEIGEPPRWTKYDDASDVNFFNNDIFDSMDNIHRAASHFKMLHNASGVHINGQYSTYMDFDNQKVPLPPYTTRKGSELYSIRAFHQMHCVTIIMEDIGYRIHNMTSKWTQGHVIHCINTLRAAVTCLADATPISYIHGMGIGHTTDGQQAWCRDFYALRKWAHNPIRQVRWKNIANDDEPDQYIELNRDL